MNKQTHCLHGHKFTKENTYVKPDGCRMCRVCQRASRSRYYKKHPNMLERHRAQSAKTNRDKKLKILTHYSPNQKLNCSWKGCNVEDVDMLSLDHINDDGAKHRRELGSGRSGSHVVYSWIIKNNYPDGFQTLCFNHQIKKHILGKRKLASQILAASAAKSGA